ncbi:NADAR family protein [Bifidobacterium sp. 82T24]|uniref:NADAR domain-containing protein n=1 Tax=Bifidobacterium pluvialisilvae TaxID=2834436 RepID=UPI001C5726FC|nr:NADAR domain-containing protein [Bifidobacterium pluvialisilvae]MBW3088128.1 NADAR family protein [Bifidobacterium pluvialisilvae]
MLVFKELRSMMKPIWTVDDVDAWRDAAMGRNDADRLDHEEWDGPKRHYFGFWNGEDWASNFHPAPFIVDWKEPDGSVKELRFECSEQWFMFRKAWRFHDRSAMDAVLQSGLKPYQYKVIGRNVQNFDETVWTEESRGYMFEALMFKFSQNPDLARQLVDTGNQVLVECSPFDAIWGVGLGKQTKDGQADDRWRDSHNWRGKNHLGFLLMDVRDVLQSDKTPFDFKYGPFIELIPQLDRPANELYKWVYPESHEEGVTPMGWCAYGPAVDHWWHLIYSTPGCTDCYPVLERSGINPWKTLQSGNYSNLNAEQVQALMTWLTRRERFGEGTICESLDKGWLLNLLKRLRDIGRKLEQDRRNHEITYERAYNMAQRLYNSRNAIIVSARRLRNGWIFCFLQPKDDNGWVIPQGGPMPIAVFEDGRVQSLQMPSDEAFRLFDEVIDESIPLPQSDS